MNKEEQEVMDLFKRGALLTNKEEGIILNYISKLEKIIDLMAKYFYKGNALKTNTLDEFKEYFYNQVEVEDE